VQPTSLQLNATTSTHAAGPPRFLAHCSLLI
jgi:hypothetical protein